MAFILTSSAFASGQPLARRHTCDGENLSPPLAWSGAPADSQAFALVMDDPDAPGGTFTHWLLSDLPASLEGLEEGVKAGRPGTAGVNGFGKKGYGGPCPPRGRGPHRYRIHLHALNAPLGLPPGYSSDQLEAALAGKILATATLGGTYERTR